MSVEDEIRIVAINEVLHPTFALTKQYLHANRLVVIDGVPFIEDIIYSEVEEVPEESERDPRDIIIYPETRRASVYFPVLNEDYYFVVHVGIGDEIVPRWMEMSPGNKVELRAVSDAALSELLKILPIVPTEVWEKGQQINESMAYKHSGLTVALSDKKTGEVENKLKSLVEFLHPMKDQLLLLAEIATTEVSIAYYGYKNEMWGIHLDPAVLQAVAQLKVSVDIDLYASGPDLE